MNGLLPKIWLLLLTVAIFYPRSAWGHFNNSFTFVSDTTLHPDGDKSKKSLPQYRIKKIVIDAGHGGHDPGCLGRESREKDIALNIVKKLARMVKETFPDVEIILTREDDRFIPLHERANIANKNDADLFISVHCNFIPNASHVFGSETYILGPHRYDENLEVAKRENSAILLEDNYELNYDYDPNTPEGHIILSMYQNAYLEQSLLFAERVEQKMGMRTDSKSRGVRQAGFLVLRATAMPSVLIEAGYLSHSNEEQYLKTDAGQEQVAASILEAFREFKSEMEGTPLAVVTPKGSAVEFRIQLAASSRPVQTQQEPWTQLGAPVEVVEENGLFKYQCPLGPLTYEQALARRDQIRNSGFPDAFLIPYERGKRITMDEAKALLQGIH